MTSMTSTPTRSRLGLLSPEEVILLSRKVQQLLTLLDIKEDLKARLKEVPSQEAWASAANLSLAELKWEIGQGQRAKRKFIEANLGLVRSITQKFRDRGVDADDLFQEGVLGLTRAVELFDPTKGFAFSTYATWWIRQAITRAIHNQSRTIRLPSGLYEQRRRVYRCINDLTERLGRTPTRSETASELEIEVQDLEALLKAFQNPTSLDAPVKNDSAQRLGDVLADDGQSPEEFATQENIAQVLAILPDRQQQVLSLRYLNDLPIKQITQELGIGRESVRLAENAAKATLRAHLESLSLAA